MKRLAILISIIFVCLGIKAQADDGLRFGYLSYETALQSMPDYAVVQKKLADLRQQFQNETLRVEDEFNRKYEDFLEGQREFPQSILQKRQIELQELMDKNIAFKENSRKELEKAEQELMAPLKIRLIEVLFHELLKLQLALLEDGLGEVALTFEEFLVFAVELVFRTQCFVLELLTEVGELLLYDSVVVH